MSGDTYKSQKPQMARLAAREGWSQERFEETYQDFMRRAKVEQAGQSIGYQICRGECWMWKVHFHSMAPFQGVEPRRNTSLAPHINVSGYDRYTPPRSTPSMTRNRHGRLITARSGRSRSPRREGTSSLVRKREEEDLPSPWATKEKPTTSWAQTALRLSSQTSQTGSQTITPPTDGSTSFGHAAQASSQHDSGTVQLPESSRLRPSIVIENNHIKDTRLFFPPTHTGLPCYSHILRQDNALRAFIGPKHKPNIAYLESHFPRLHFRKANVAGGLLIWVEMPLDTRHEQYRLSNFDRAMLEAANALLKCYASLRDGKLPDIDVFVKRYCDGRYDA